MRLQRLSILIPWFLVAPVAGAAPASSPPPSAPVSVALAEGRGCLTPEDPPGSPAAIAGEQTLATCGRRGICDDPETRDGAVRRTLNLRAVAHVIRASDGTCTLSDAEVRAVIDEINADLRANGAGIQVDLQGIRGHVDDEIAWLPICSDNSCTETRRLIYLAREMYAEAPEAQLNFYFSCQRNSQFGGLAGAGSFPWYASSPAASMGLWLNSRAIAGGPDHIGTHEFGHVVGLLHTHRGFSEVTSCNAGCVEYVSGFEGDIRGDFAADTPVTPENTTCTPPGGRDCNGDVFGPTQPENYMGYGPPSCVNLFTPNQIQRVQCWTQIALRPWYSTPAGPCRRDAGGSTVALWHFDEASGTALVEDLGAADGALLGTAARARSHCGSPCLTFPTTGAGGGARLPGVDFTAPRGTVSCSFRWTGGAGGWLFDRERTVATSDLGALLTADGRIHFHVGGAERAVSRAVEAGRWYRLACAWDGATARIEIDDMPDASAPATATPAAGTGALLVGCAGISAPSTGTFDGQIDEVTIQRTAGANPPFPEPDRSLQLRLSAIPNPFRRTTSITFVLPTASRAELRVVDLLGRRVATLVDQVLPAGPHRFEWDGRRASQETAPPGVYVVRLAAAGASRGTRLVRIP